jgi:hypothetical protein
MMETTFFKANSIFEYCQFYDTLYIIRVTGLQNGRSNCGSLAMEKASECYVNCDRKVTTQRHSSLSVTAKDVGMLTAEDNFL